jgi:hypothetical protein
LRHKIEVNPLSAVDRKVLFTTNERKEMSSKTFFKRIALTAIAALGAGLISVAPSAALVTANTLTIDSATDAINTGDTATAVFSHSFVQSAASDSVTVRAILTSGPTSGAGGIRLQVSDSGTSVSDDFPDYVYAGVVGTSAWSLVTPDTSASAPDSVTVTNGTAGRTIRSDFRVRFYGVSKPGTYEITMYTTLSDAGGNATTSLREGASSKWTITVTDRDTKATTASTTTLRTYGGSIAQGTAEGTDSASMGSAYSCSDAGTACTPNFTIFTRLKNTAGASLASVAQESLTATIDGPGYLSTSASDLAASKSKVLTFNSDAAPDADGTALYVYSSDGEGTATVTIKTVTSGLTVGTKTITWYGRQAGIEIGTSIYKIARSGPLGYSTAGMFTVKVTDAGGRTVPGVSFSNISDNAGAIASTTCTDTTGDSSLADGVYSCAVATVAGSTSGSKATITVRAYKFLSTTTFWTVDYAVTLGGGVSTVVLTLDKPSTPYETGEKMVVTATAKDASGNPVYDGLAGPSLSSNKQLGGTNSAIGGALTMNAYVGGVSTSQTRSATTGLVTTQNTLFAPSSPGKFEITGLAGDAAGTPVSVSGTVGDDVATNAANAASDAAAEAIDAANAATDAANLAAEAADAATVAAEEARDAADAATAAVEALATEVATLMAALKAQITTLANTVAKIAKKVKA